MAEKTMNFGGALDEMLRGYRVTRTGWNGKGMYVFLHRPGVAAHADCLMLRTVDITFVPWTISQTDALATDWEVVPE